MAINGCGGDGGGGGTGLARLSWKRGGEMSVVVVVVVVTNHDKLC